MHDLCQPQVMKTLHLHNPFTLRSAVPFEEGQLLPLQQMKLAGVKFISRSLGGSAVTSLNPESSTGHSSVLRTLNAGRGSTTSASRDGVFAL